MPIGRTNDQNTLRYILKCRLGRLESVDPEGAVTASIMNQVKGNRTLSATFNGSDPFTLTMTGISLACGAVVPMTVSMPTPSTGPPNEMPR